MWIAANQQIIIVEESQDIPELSNAGNFALIDINCRP